MGQTLSEPVTEKTSDKGEDGRVMYGVSAMQGWRISMEDAHAAILDLKLEGDQEKTQDPSQKISFFGVYDGHGGDKVALFAGQNIHKIIMQQEAFKKGDFEQALKDGFLATDKAILSDPRYEEEVSGCTASVGIITPDKIYVANAGDSRSVLGVKGRAKPLSYDHKPGNESEKARITAAGGFVDFGRVNGNLALSRAIGDFEFKKGADLPPEQQIVTAFPDVITHDISEDDEFLVIACDGIWDCQSSQAVVEFVRRGIAAKQELYRICENMMDNCLASNSETGGVGCDNMTMMIVGLLQGKTKEQWYDEVARRVANGDGPCAPPEYGKSFGTPGPGISRLADHARQPAEFRGPGVHHTNEESADEFDADLDRRFGAHPSGRIILLGDGTEVLTDSRDAEILDHDDEDKDLESQVGRGQTSNGAETASPVSTESSRSQRGATPASDGGERSEQAQSPQTPKSINSTSVPEKLFTPPKSEVKNAIRSPFANSETATK